MCHQFFHYKDISIVYCGCTYHHWCFGFLLGISKVYGHISYGENFDSKWCKNVGFMLGDGKLEPQPNPSMLEGNFSTIWVSSVCQEVVTIFIHYFFSIFSTIFKILY